MKTKKYSYSDLMKIKKLLKKSFKLDKQAVKSKDFQRIYRILELIEKIWTKNPDLRLCQLIGNCFVAGDNYYKEDDELEKRLKGEYGV